MKRYTRLLLLLLSGTFLFSCSTGPEFERANSNDPASNNFQPKIHSLKAELNNDKTVSVSWSDNSRFEDGIVVAKSLGENGPIKVLDTLSANSVHYTDNSKLLDLNTTYYVGAFKKGAAVIDSSRFFSKKLDFGEFQAIDYTSKGNEITLNWSSSFSYVDKFLISERKTANTSTPIDTIEGNRSDFTFLVDYKSYSMDLEVSALLYNQNDELVKLHHKAKDSVAFNIPSISSLTLVNEAIINLSLDDNSSFDDEFIVYERTRSAWHQPYSDFIPIDTVASSGNILISQNENYEREYAIEGIYKNERTGLTDTIEVEIYSRPLHKCKNSIISVSPTSVKLIWEDANEINSANATYQFELSLYNSETDELLRKIVLSPNTNQHTFENLSPTSKYEFILKTYNSYTPEPLAFSVQTVLEKTDEIILAQSDAVNDAKILTDQEMIVYSPYKDGASGLKAFDINTNSSHTIYDTGEDPSEYENKFIEDFLITDNMEMFATKRIILDVLTEVFLYVVNSQSDSPQYFKKQISLNTNDDEIHLSGFISDSELIYIKSNPGLEVYKWNFHTNETERIFERHNIYYFSSYINDDRIMIGTSRRLLVLNKDGIVFQEVHSPNYGRVKKIVTSSIPDSYNLNISDALYRYNITANTLERLGEIHHMKAFFEVPKYKYIISRQEHYIAFLNLDTGSQVYQINDSDRQLSFQNGAFLPNKDQVIFQNGSLIKIFNPNNTWIITTATC